MSRIYSPESYGLFSVFNSILSNLSVIAFLTYTGAFFLERDSLRFYSLVLLTMVLSVVTSIVCGIILFFFKTQVLDFFQIDALGNWIYLLPVFLLIFSLTSIFTSWLVKEKFFSKIAGVNVGSSLSGKLLSIGFGFFLFNNVYGLLLGDFVSKLVSFFSLGFSGLQKLYNKIFTKASFKNLKNVAYEYRNFPLYQLPTSYLDVIAVQAPVYVLSASFGVSNVGLYAFSTTLLDLPINLLGRSVAPVFFQKASELVIESKEQLQKLTTSIFYKVFYLGLIPVSIISVYGDLIFKYVFGDRWEMAGVFTAFLGYSYIFKLTVSATSGVFALYNKQKAEFTFNIIGLVLKVSALLLGVYLKDLKLAILFFGIASAASSILINFMIFKVLNLPAHKIIGKAVALVICSFLLFKGIRILIEYSF
ncbi:oligosaccharide flippase family protein [Adhaeribacter terreus]|uniref:Oligosaccharide flippase family protein n=1 Tax=Adhaeribacter terreus TaxID=529703 RepID=A0ABW0E8I0_9BACT